MRLSFIVNDVVWSPWDTRIGGSEEMIVETSRLLAKEHEVRVFHNGQHGMYENVLYLPYEDYEPGSVTINVNYPQFKPQGKTIYWSTLTENPNLDEFDAVCAISEYAKKNTGLPERTIIIPPGYDPTKIYSDKKVPKQCFYASSPDRGLDVLLEAWPQVMTVHPDATLLLTYGAPETDLPGVINLGECDEETMNDVYRTSDVWCHPCTGSELYCMTGVKAQVAGCIPVIIPHMALKETIRHGIFLAPTNTPGDYTTYEECLNAALDGKGESQRKLILEETYPSWQDSTQKLLAVIENVLK